MCPDANIEFTIVGGMHDPGSLGGAVLLYENNEITAKYNVRNHRSAN